MLVAISGSQGCGKSTVINKLKEMGFKTIERKTSRSILSDWNVTLEEVNNDYDLTLKFQDEIITRKHQDELVALQNPHHIWFTERTYADLFTYSLITLGKENKYSDWLDRYYNRCSIHQQTYDLVYYLSAGHFAIQHDGVRGSSIHYSRAVDLVMLDVTNQLSHPSTISMVSTPDLNHRAQMIANRTRGVASRIHYHT